LESIDNLSQTGIFFFFDFDPTLPARNGRRTVVKAGLAAVANAARF
jgi:hypothetical protein